MASQNMLHILGPRRWDAVAAIVGDRAALEGLRRALNEALETGSGGAVAATSDGESYLLAVALQPDMQAVHTTYADEIDPVRSLRERIPLRQIFTFHKACTKARHMQMFNHENTPARKRAKDRTTSTIERGSAEP